MSIPLRLIETHLISFFSAHSYGYELHYFTSILTSLTENGRDCQLF